MNTKRLRLWVYTPVLLVTAIVFVVALDAVVGAESPFFYPLAFLGGVLSRPILIGLTGLFRR